MPEIDILYTQCKGPFYDTLALQNSSGMILDSRK